MNSGQTYMIPYVPTAMDKTNAPGISLPHYRESDEVFMRGYRERISIACNSGVQWRWRRICFRSKGSDYTSQATATTPLWLESSPNGWVRTATNALGTNLGTAILSNLFKGAINVDWDNYFTAKVDTNRCTIDFDKTMYFRNGNTLGHFHEKRFWHSMNKNFYYRADELGDTEAIGLTHSSGLRGMGDYYIVDFISGLSDDTDNSAVVTYSGTLYWHEK